MKNKPILEHLKQFNFYIPEESEVAKKLKKLFPEEKPKTQRVKNARKDRND